jgi:hypothetical protein
MLIFNIIFLLFQSREYKSGFKTRLYRALDWLDDVETYREDIRYCNKWCYLEGKDSED